MPRDTRNKKVAQDQTDTNDTIALINSLIAHVSSRRRKVFAFRSDGGRGDVFEVPAPVVCQRGEEILNVAAAHRIIGGQLQAGAVPTF